MLTRFTKNQGGESSLFLVIQHQGINMKAGQAPSCQAVERDAGVGSGKGGREG